jgi:hypothetical protein
MELVDVTGLRGAKKIKQPLSNQKFVVLNHTCIRIHGMCLSKLVASTHALLADLSVKKITALHLFLQRCPFNPQK